MKLRQRNEPNAPTAAPQKTRSSSITKLKQAQKVFDCVQKSMYSVRIKRDPLR